MDKSNELVLESSSNRLGLADFEKKRSNAVFIYAKLIAGGLEQRTAKVAVEKLWHDGFDEGYAVAQEPFRSRS